jgi:MoxR-like ATPase
VTVQGRTYVLEEPFHVFATQNPIELEGTYPLPEAQLDRFMFQIVIDHLPEADEREVVRATTTTPIDDLRQVMTGEDVLAYQQLVRRVPVSESVLQYAVSLVRRSRPGADALDAIREWVGYGASVRAAQYLTLGAKARALLQGRTHVDFEDVRALAQPVLRHRVLLNFHAQSERVTTGQVIDSLLAGVSVPRSGM